MATQPIRPSLRWSAFFAIFVLLGLVAGRNFMVSHGQPGSGNVAEAQGVVSAVPSVAGPSVDGMGQLATPKIGAGNCRFFVETKRTLCDVFLNYWERFGGLSIFGYPLTWEITEEGRTVQYFERAKFEYHPETAGTDWAVMGELMGRVVTAGRETEPAFQYIPDVHSTDNCTGYLESGHYLCGGFRTYWESHGGLWLFGYPISEEFQELNADTGEVYTVQYFERARFEWHPEFAGTENQVLLGRLGFQLYSERYPRAKDLPLVNVKDYGATGDGTSDDTDAIYAALNAASQTSEGAGIIYLPAGTYMMRGFDSDHGDKRLLNKGSVIVGENMDTTTIKLIASSVGVDWRGIRLLRIMGGTRITNLTFDGSRDAFDRAAYSWKASGLLYTDHKAKNIVFEHLRLQNAYGQKDGDRFRESFGIVCSACRNTVIRNIESLNNDGSGIAVAGDMFGARANNVTVSNILSYNNRSMGVSLFAAENVVAENIISYNNRRGINMEWSTDVVFRNVQTYANHWYGVSMVGVNERISFENIQSWDNGTDTNYPDGGEFGINAHAWLYELDPATNTYLVGISQGISITNSQITPASGRPHFSIVTSEDYYQPQTFISARFPEEIVMQSEGTDTWKFRVDGVEVAEPDLAGYVEGAFGVVVRTR